MVTASDCGESDIDEHATPLPIGKSKSLAWLREHLTTARVPPFVSITVDDWKRAASAFVEECATRFGERPLAVRSDAHIEDGNIESHAGRFLSLCNVGRESLAAALSRVASSAPGHPNDRVIVQVMVEDIVVAGVASTHRIADGAPWYCLELAPFDSAAVTSGRAQVRQVAIARDQAMRASAHLGESERIVLATLIEVEMLSDGRPVEIEFAITRDSDDRLLPHLLQARPITTIRTWRPRGKLKLHRLPPLTFLNESDPLPRVAGKRTVLSLMSDWNPAELIGTHPRPLALSLFDRLIARGVWWAARASLDYCGAPATDVALLRLINGRPFVDVRRSANSLVPHDVPWSVRATLVDAWVSRLANDPVLHDKVEFAVYRSVRDFCPIEQLRREWSSLLSESDRGQWEMSLGTLTRRVMLRGPGSTFASQLDIIDQIDRQPIDETDWPALLSLCAEGTRAFAVLARIAFAAETQLRSAITRGALRPERATALRAAGCSTPVDQSQCLADDFIARHGHLRPGTFDITQRSWAHSDFPRDARTATTARAFSLSSKEQRSLHRLLVESSLPDDANSWVQFLQQSATARERAKFVFSRSLSKAMDRIGQMTAASGLDHECASWLTLDQLATGKQLPHQHRGRFWQESAMHAETKHRAESLAIVSPVLRDDRDRMIADSLGAMPNFIGRTVVEGPVVFLHDGQSIRPVARDAIVVVRQADPGFDWLFACGIGGLITAWGGANSHLAIRCAEYGLSAAVGCGEAVFAQAATATRARLDPEGGALWLT